MPAPSWFFTKASPEGLAHAHDFAGGLHLGPRMVSTPGNLTKGNTASFTLKYGG